MLGTHSVRRVLLVVASLVVAILAGGGAWLAWKANQRPSVEAMRARTLPVAEPREGEPRVRFLGVSTVLVEDGRSAVLIDGFFSRPGLLRVLLGKVAPDPAAIAHGLALGGIEKLDAVVVAHSHYDHALDSPEVARRTGAVLVGSRSTANVGRGSGFPEERIRVVDGEVELTFGSFRLTLVPSRHVPHGMAMGEIAEPLVPPARALDYLEGGSFSILVEHPRGSLLVQASAGWIDGALAGRHADVVLLGIGALGAMDDAYRDAYWREVVAAVGARRVLPIHWDDFTEPLAEPLPPVPNLVDDLERTLAFLEERSRAAGVDLGWLPLAAPVDPFAGLAAAPGPGAAAPAP